MMAEIIKQYKKNPVIREYCTALVSHLPGKDWDGECQTLLSWVQKHIRYVQDINDVETLQTPVATALLGHGDCDDMVILLCTMLETIGYQTRSVAIGFQPNCFEHVYLEIYFPDNNKWIAADPTEPYKLGWHAEGYTSILRCLN